MKDFIKNIFSKSVEDTKESSDSVNNENDEVSKGIQLELSLSPNLEGRTSNVVREMHEGELESFSPMKEGDINISSSYIYDDGERIEVSLYVRNALTKPVKFEVIPLIIIGQNGEVYARQTFSGSDLGEVPSFSARPWKIYFDKSSVLIEDFPVDTAKVVFDSQNMKVRTNDPKDYDMFPSGMPDEMKKGMLKHISELRQLSDDEVDITAYDIACNKETSQLAVCLIIRNGGNKNISVQEIPLVLAAADETIVARQKFVLDDFSIMAKSTRVIILNFDYMSIIDIDADLSSWKIGFFNE